MQRVIKVFIGTLIFAMVAWRAMWLSAGLADITSQADDFRQSTLPSLSPVATMVDDYEWLVVFGETQTSPENEAGSNPNWTITQTQIWDPTAEVWIVPGKDRQPGWAKWDDNGNGQVDELSELGAAWSDDYCVTPLSAKFEQINRERSRLIQEGTFRVARLAATGNPTRQRGNKLQEAPRLRVGLPRHTAFAEDDAVQQNEADAPTNESRVRFIVARTAAPVRETQ